MKLSEIPVNKEQVTFSGILSLLFRTIWKDFKLLFFAILATAIVSGFFQLTTPRIIQKIIDQLISGITTVDSLITLAILAAISLFLGALFEMLTEKLSFYVTTRVEDLWRYASLFKFYQLPMSWQDQHDSGEIGAKIDRGGGAIWGILYEVFGQKLIVSLITFLFVIVYIIWIFPQFALIFILPIPVYVFVTYLISKRIALMQAQINKLDHEASRVFFDGVGNIRYVKTFGKEYAETKKYAHKWSSYHRLEYKLNKIWLWQGFLQKLIEAIMRAVLLIISIIAVSKTTLTVGQVVLLLSFQQLTFLPLQQLNQLFTRLRRLTKRASHLFDLVAEDDNLKDTVNAREISSLKEGIDFEKVHFEYSKKLQTLDDITLTLRAGTTTAIVGRSGAGKTTLAMLLLRFYDPDQGRITWDGIDLRKIKRSSLREKITLILQDTTLFNRSIAENIAYGKSASQREIEGAAKLAHAHDFILKLPKGYHSIVGERGVRLSGGQRQRIAIARALLIKPELLVLDEATSHLDSETELAIKEAIQYLQGKNTQVIIAHRLSTVQHADNIILLDKGKIIAQGRHTELLKFPLYRKLCQLQLQR